MRGVSHYNQEELYKFLKTFLFIFFLAVLGLHCWVQAFSSRGERGYSPNAVPGLLIAVASLIARVQVLEQRLNICSTRAQQS